MPEIKNFFIASSAVALFLKKHKSKIVMVVTLLSILTVITTATRTITTQPLLADDAFNLQVPYNLVKIGSYASFGAVWEGADKVFDPYLTTGPVISLPITLVFKIFGIGIVQARIVMLL